MAAVPAATGNGGGGGDDDDDDGDGNSTLTAWLNETRLEETPDPITEVRGRASSTGLRDVPRHGGERAGLVNGVEGRTPSRR